MANEVLVKQGTAIVWANSSDYSSTVSGLTRTHAMDFTSIATVAYEEGAKADMEYLATAKYPSSWLMLASLEFAVAPTSGEVVDFYWGGSLNATAGTGNPAGMDGVGGIYTGTTDSAADSVKQLIYVGSMVLTSDVTTTVQTAKIGILSGIPQYGMPLIYNGAGQATVADSVEQYIALIPLVDEVQ